MTSRHQVLTAAGTAPPLPQTVPVVELVAGTRIKQYELIRELGRGGMGQVWAARDTRLGRRVAMKFLITAEREVAERFLVEARATAQCSHDNIVIIYEVDQIAGLPYMVLEFLEGDSLRAVMGGYQCGVQLATSRVVELVLPVARALARAHELGIVHRDLKPENVFVTNAGQVKVLDFGIAKALGAANDCRPITPEMLTSISVNAGTRQGVLVGTPPYMPPEQFGLDTVDTRSDLWALGIMMFEMLTGRLPVESDVSALFANAVSLDSPMLSIAAFMPQLPPELADLVDRCLQKRKAQRIATAVEVITRLEHLQPHRRGRQLVEGESPYPGLAAFQEGDADRFFGRGRDLARMVSRVRELPLTGVVGPSGVGKSSFIRAGVGPALKASGEAWDVVTLRPGRQPMAALATIVTQLTTGDVASHQQLAYRLYTEPGYLGALLRERAQRTSRRILLFVDQFEELYTLVPDVAERRAFTASLAGVADDAATPLRVVVSMRSDFLDRIAEDPTFLEDLSKGLVFLMPPDRDGLREALVQPVEMVGHHFESQAIVDDMLGALSGIAGALPLLQFAAAKLWDARDRERRVITEASYRAIGGISGALATHADHVVTNLSAAAQLLTQKVFRRLVTPERTRAIVEVGDLEQLAPDRAELARVIDRLVAARLLVVQTRGDGGGGTVEIVHESLIDRWPTLRRWLDEEQEDAVFVAQLAAAAKQWDARARPAGLLWRGDAMEEARRWVGARPRELALRERAFLDAVFALARRGKRARRIALVVAFATLGTVAAGASVAVVLVRAAEQEANANAEKERQARTDLEAKQRERDEAEARKRLAEAKEQEATMQKAAVLQQKAVVEQQRQTAEAKVAESEEELKRQNVALQAALVQANLATKKAQDASVAAQQATAEAQRASAALKAQNEAQATELRKLNPSAVTRTLK